jgi:hypothetical protein
LTNSEKSFLGTFFDQDAVLRFARVFLILSWVIAAIYAADVLIGLAVFGLQFARGFLSGMGFTDIFQNVLFIIERPVHGILYFAVLQTLGRGLQIALDIEENTRRAARK